MIHVDFAIAFLGRCPRAQSLRAPEIPTLASTKLFVELGRAGAKDAAAIHQYATVLQDT
jgi:hypothetical protein